MTIERPDPGASGAGSIHDIFGSIHAGEMILLDKYAIIHNELTVKSNSIRSRLYDI